MGRAGNGSEGRRRNEAPSTGHPHTHFSAVYQLLDKGGASRCANTQGPGGSFGFWAATQAPGAGAPLFQLRKSAAAASSSRWSGRRRTDRRCCCPTPTGYSRARPGVRKPDELAHRQGTSGGEVQQHAARRRGELAECSKHLDRAQSADKGHQSCARRITVEDVVAFCPTRRIEAVSE